MKQRLISAAVGLPLAAVVIFFYDTILLNIAMAAVTFAAVYEIFVATKYLNSRGLILISFIFAAYVPFSRIAKLRVLSLCFCFGFIFALFIFLLFNHRTMRFEQIGTVFMITLLLSFSFSCIVFTRDYFKMREFAPRLGMFYIILIFLGAWITDAGAYFMGRLFGRHKLAPEISPKKTVEGAVGGFVFAVVFFIAAALIYAACVAAAGRQVTVNYPALVILAVLSAAAAIVGDLSASIIKRECNIKDFGNVIPGHGGVMDRFDSVMFVAPIVYIFLQVMPVIRH
jgi:phosphatidate cytidylyltransferase